MSRASDRELKHKSLVDAAFRLVEGGGLEALTVQRLATELDWAVGALYRYFPSKDALLAELQAAIVADYREALGASLACARADALTRLALVGVHFQRWFSARPARLATLAVHDPRALLPDAEAGHVMSEVGRLLDLVGAEVAAAAPELAPGDVADRTTLLWATLQGVVQLRKLSRVAPGRLDNDRLLRHALRTLLVGFGADAARADAAVARAETLLKEDS